MGSITVMIDITDFEFGMKVLIITLGVVSALCGFFIGLIIVLILGLTRGCVNAIKKLTMVVLHSASSPSTSPFSYFAALVGLLVLVVKVFYEIAITVF